MTLKFKLSIFISIGFTLLYGIMSVVIVAVFAVFRQEEFKERLDEKALTSIKLLVDVKEIDNHLLQTIDQFSINKLYNEKTLIFDANYRLIYSSLDDTKVHWTTADLDYLREHKDFFKKDGENEIYGVNYDTQGGSFYALISAYDSSGKRKQQFLIYVLIIAWIVFTTAASLLSFYATKKLLQPLDFFQRKIQQINENNLETRVEVRAETENEIDLIGREFNFLMQRLEHAYSKQKDFTAQASHELRTPLARMSAQLENLIPAATPEWKPKLEEQLTNVNQLTALINSLLILSRVDNPVNRINEQSRIDETLFKSIEKIHKQEADFKVKFHLDADSLSPDALLITINPVLLETVFDNLLKNACQYAANKQVDIALIPEQQGVSVVFTNAGPTLTEEEQSHLFEPFMRGSNARNKPGIGLGLRMVQRILHAYGFDITYQGGIEVNVFEVKFF